MVIRMKKSINQWLKKNKTSPITSHSIAFEGKGDLQDKCFNNLKKKCDTQEDYERTNFEYSEGDVFFEK